MRCIFHLTTLVIYLVTWPTAACLQIPGLPEGDNLLISKTRPVAPALQLIEKPRFNGNQLIEKFAADPTPKGRISYAAGLIFLGRYGEAIELLKALEKEKPGSYAVASNLGTAYELAGDDVEALHWIGEGLKRNPSSHNGSEWIHLRILEAKVAARLDPSFFEEHTVLDLRPPLRIPVDGMISVGSTKIQIFDLHRSLLLQLQERLQFANPPNPIIAAMLFDLAALEAALRTLKEAKGVLVMAKEFGYSSSAVDGLISDYDRVMGRARVIFHLKWGVPAVVIIGLLLRWRLRKGKGLPI